MGPPGLTQCRCCCYLERGTPHVPLGRKREISGSEGVHAKDIWRSGSTGFQTAFSDRAQEHPHCHTGRRIAAGTAPLTEGETEGGHVPSLRPHCLCQLMGVSWLPNPQALGVRATFSIRSQCVLETWYPAQTPAAVLPARPRLQPHRGLDYSSGVEEASKQHGGPLGLSFPFK